VPPGLAVDAEAVDLLTAPPEGFAVLAATDVLLAPMLALGAHGAIVASANVATAAYVALAAAPRPPDAAPRPAHAAAALDLEAAHRLARLSAALFAAPNPTVIKAVLHAQGRIPTPEVRLPLTPPPAGAVANALADLAVVARAYDRRTRQVGHHNCKIDGRVSPRVR